MKQIKNITFATLTALAVAMVIQTSSTRADEHGQRGNDLERGGRDHRDAKSTFTKWVTDWPNMAGVVGGAVGDGIFAGEVLKYSPGPVTKIEALYQFTGPKHSFTALVHVEQTGSGPGTHAVITGVVTEGWLKGHAVKGKYTEGTCGTPSMPCYSGTLEIDGDCND